MMIGRQIKYYRTINNMTQTELGHKLYVNRQTVSKWERHDVFPDLQTLINISKLFNVSLDKLILNKDSKKVINITNGDCYNTFIKAMFDEEFIPFREAMVEGKTDTVPFSNEYNLIRASFHKVSIDNYLAHMGDFYQILNSLDSYDEIALWFGKDLFCQINLLTILAYFDLLKINKDIYIIIIDDVSKKVIRGKKLLVKDLYYEKYKLLLLEKKVVHFDDEFLNEAAAEYLDLDDENGTIARLIIEAKDKLSYKQLIEMAWRKTRKLGLGDTQVINLVHKYL